MPVALVDRAVADIITVHRLAPAEMVPMRGVEDIFVGPFGAGQQRHDILRLVFADAVVEADRSPLTPRSTGLKPGRLAAADSVARSCPALAISAFALSLLIQPIAAAFVRHCHWRRRPPAARRSSSTGRRSSRRRRARYYLWTMIAAAAPWRAASSELVRSSGRIIGHRPAAEVPVSLLRLVISGVVDQDEDGSSSPSTSTPA